MVASVLAALALLANGKMKKKDKTLIEKFEEKELTAEIGYSLSNLRYIVSGNLKSDTAVFFIHGAPGSLDAYLPYFFYPEMQQKYMLLAVDRPGYGESDKTPILSVKAQADRMLEIVHKYPNKKWILVGHSYGVPIAGILSCLMPEITVKSILLAGAVDPNLEKFEWLARISNSAIARRILPHAIDVSTLEKLSHRQQLQEVEPLWQSVSVPTYVVHGTSDILVPYKNVEFLKERIPNQFFHLQTIQKENHFFLFSDKTVLLNYLK